mgnify:CR=1 FL=1
MPWHPSLNQLRDALANLYTREADARRIIATAGLDDRRILFDPSAINTWQSILEEAEKQEYIDQIITVALDEYPRNRALRAAVDAYRQSTSGRPPVEKQGTDAQAPGPKGELAGGATNQAQVSGTGNIVAQDHSVVPSHGGIAIGGNVEGGIHLGRADGKEEEGPAPKRRRR